jgi:hypothetical protein
MKCHMEYEEGTPFCSNCGGDLVVKEKPKSEKEDDKKGAKGKADGKLVCPKCHILYEKMSSCIRCGTPLVTQSALKEMKEFSPPPARESKKTESKGAPPSEVEKKPSPVPSAKKPPVEPRRGEPKQPYAADMMQEPTSIEAAEKGPAKEFPEEKRERAPLQEKRKKSFFRSLYGILLIILLLMVATYVVINRLLTEETIQSTEKESSSISQEEPGIPVSSIPVVLLPQEVEKVKGVLENIRQANLTKNISLFMSCYAPDFKDREERRSATLEHWSKYNYLDLIYSLKIDSMSIHSAQATVEWRIRFIPKTGGQLEEGRSILDVTFEKNRNEWKIKEVAPKS